MAASRLSSLAAMAAAATAASCSTRSDRAYAESPFRFNPFSTSSSSSSSSNPSQTESSSSDSKSEPEDSRGGFDPESLERGAKALREINSSPHAKQVFEVMRKQEQSRLAELAAEKAHYEAIQSRLDIAISMSKVGFLSKLGEN